MSSKERPISFSGEMVRAILYGTALSRTKTQTRRPIELTQFGVSDTQGYEWNFRDRQMRSHDVNTDKLLRKFCPFGQIGDRLWVREAINGIWGCDATYEADGERIVDAHPFGWDVWLKGRSSPLKCGIIPPRHMPRWASRILLEIENVRVERIQDISPKDAKAEGCVVDEPRINSSILNRLLIFQFRNLWNSIYAGKGFCWEANPFVWVITFRRIDFGGVS